MNLINKICNVLYEPDWYKYRDYRYKNGIPIDWSTAERKLKRETAKKIITIIKEVYDVSTVLSSAGEEGAEQGNHPRPVHRKH